MTEPASDFLNSVALGILPLLDARYVGLFGLLLAVVISAWRRTRNMPPLNAQSMLNLVLSVVLQVNGLGVGCVLILMSPPAIKGVSRETLVLAGLATLISCFSLGRDTIKTIALSPSFGKQPNSQNASEGQQ